MSPRFVVSRCPDQVRYEWRLISGEGEQSVVLARSLLGGYATQEEAVAAVGHFCQAVAEAVDILESVRTPGVQRWRKIRPDGTMTDEPSPQLEGPDYDEGETGPTEVQG